MIEQIASILAKGEEDRTENIGGKNKTVNESTRTHQLLSGSSSRATGPADGRSAATEQIGYDQIFEILKNRRRRDVLRQLKGSVEHIEIGDLAEQISAKENDKTVRELTSQERKRVYVSLYQCHLPKMDDTNVISYNKPRGKIEAGENLPVLTAFLPENERQ